MGRMAARTVITHCDLCQPCRRGLCVRVKVLQREQCSLSGVQDALRHGLLPTVARAAHTRRSPVLRPELPIPVSPILPATVGMPAEPCRRVARPERQRQRLLHPRCPPRSGHGPADHRARAYIQPDSQSQPAGPRGPGGDIPNREGIGRLPRQRSGALVRCHRLGLPGGARGFAPALRWAAPAGLGQHAPQAPAAARSSLLGSQVRAPARPVRAPPLGTIGLSCGLPSAYPQEFLCNWASHWYT